MSPIRKRDVTQGTERCFWIARIAHGDRPENDYFPKFTLHRLFPGMCGDDVPYSGNERQPQTWTVGSAVTESATTAPCKSKLPPRDLQISNPLGQVIFPSASGLVEMHTT